MKRLSTCFPCILLLLVLFAQLLFSAKEKSPTIDEPNHLTLGYVYLKTGDLRFSSIEGNPPLFNVLCALPLLLLKNLTLPLYHPSWAIGLRNAFATLFLFGGQTPLDLVFFLSRLPMMFTTLCLAALIARWAGELYGPWGSLVSLLLAAMDPNLIAHGQLVTTDVGVTFFFLLTLYLFSQFLRRQANSPRSSRTLLVLTGVSLGLALCSKFSGILLLPILGLWGLMNVIRGLHHGVGRACSVTPPPTKKARWKHALQEALQDMVRLAGEMIVLIVAAWLAVWAVYRFQIGRPAGWPIPVPAPAFVQAISGTLLHASEAGHAAFLMGQYSDTGWWYYFPVALVLKTPLPALILLLGALASLAWKRSRRAAGSTASEWPLLLAAAVYFGFSVKSVVNIGYRYLLPMLPCLWIFAGRIGPCLADLWQQRQRRWVVYIPAALGLWLVNSTLGVAPDYLAYFNELAGGPDGGWRYLVDSNLDWAQDVPALKKYAEKHQDKTLYLSWFGSTYAHLYGLDLEYRLLPGHYNHPYASESAGSPYNPLYPEPGLYAISATNLQGVALDAGDVFARFRDGDLQTLVARPGHSIFVYRVEGSPGPANPTCIAGLRLRDLTTETLSYTLGRGPGWVKWFDQDTSFILPAQGDAAYALPTLPLGFARDWQAAFQTHASVVYEQTGQGGRPAAVYWLGRAEADDLAQIITGAVQTSPIWWSGATRFDANPEMHPLAAPVVFDHGLELLGYRLISGPSLQPGQALELATVWRTTAEMPAATIDLKAFVHVLDANGVVKAGEDRLDLSTPTWQPGDLLVQHHRLSLPADLPPGAYQVELGLYLPYTMQRLAVHEGDKLVGDRLLLQPAQIE